MISSFHKLCLALSNSLCAEDKVCYKTKRFTVIKEREALNMKGGQCDVCVFLRRNSMPLLLLQLYWRQQWHSIYTIIFLALSFFPSVNTCVFCCYWIFEGGVRSILKGIKLSQRILSSLSIIITKEYCMSKRSKKKQQRLSEWKIQWWRNFLICLPFASVGCQSAQR